MNRIQLLSTVVAVTLLGALPALARDHFPTQIPNGEAASCTTCHDGDPPVEANLNIFGDQVHDSGLDGGHQNVIWANVFALDADGDGCTNGFELGDPDGTWTPGATPGAVVGNPALAGDCAAGDGDGDGDVGDGGGDGDGDGDTGDGDGDTGDGDGDGDAGDGDVDGGTGDALGGGCSHNAPTRSAPFGLAVMFLLVSALVRPRRQV